MKSFIAYNVEKISIQIHFEPVLGIRTGRGTGRVTGASHSLTNPMVRNISRFSLFEESYKDEI